jgi:hypothetical protein
MPPWLRQYLPILIGFIIVVAVGFYAVRWLASKPAESLPTKSLAAAWGEAIQKFGIDPVFPPEEDLTVGDVLAVIIQDNDPLPEKRTDTQSLEAESIDFRTPFLKRSVKIAHVDVRKELEEAYNKLATFPGSVKAQADDKQPPGTDPKSPPQNNVVRQFTKEVLESNLPRAAFANLKSAANANAAGAITANNQASASYGASNQGYEEFRLSEVSTYGLPNARALEQLNKYCSDQQTKDDCRESIIRRYLQPLIGDRIYTKYLDPQGNEFNAVEIGIVIVNRVYLARSIVHRRREGREQSGGILTSLFSGGGNKTNGATPEQPAPAPAPSGRSGDTQSDDPLKKRIDELEKEVARMRTGGGISSQSSSSDESEFDTGRLDRPVAFGFRYVRFEFPKDDNKTSDGKQ